MIRTTSVADSVNEVTKSRFAGELPMMISRCSWIEWSSSGKIRASGSAKTRAASAKPTPCFFRFARSLRSFHSKTVGMYAYLQHTRPGPAEKDHRSQATRRRSIWKGINGAFGALQAPATNQINQLHGFVSAPKLPLTPNSSCRLVPASGFLRFAAV